MTVLVVQPPPEQVVQPGTFTEAIQIIAPPWLQDTDSVKVLFALGLNVDFTLDWIRLGVLQRFPNVGQTRPEALVAIGRDRQISRGQFEPQDSYAERVREARTTWKLAGNAQTLLKVLRAYFLPSPPLIRYVVNGVDENGLQFADWLTILPDGTIERHRASPSNWDWDGQVPTTVAEPVTGRLHATLVRFWVLIYLPASPIFWGALGSGPSGTGSGLNWDPGTFGPFPAVWGFAGSNQWYVDVKNLIAKWKAAASHAGVLPRGCDGGIIGVFGDETTIFNPENPPGGTGALSMPDGTWGDFANRPPDLAVYLSGV